MRTETDLEQILYLFRDYFPLCNRQHPKDNYSSLPLRLGNGLVGGFRQPLLDNQRLTVDLP